MSATSSTYGGTAYSASYSVREEAEVVAQALFQAEEGESAGQQLARYNKLFAKEVRRAARRRLQAGVTLPRV